MNQINEYLFKDVSELCKAPKSTKMAVNKKALKEVDENFTDSDSDLGGEFENPEIQEQGENIGDKSQQIVPVSTGEKYPGA